MTDLGRLVDELRSVAVPVAVHVGPGRAWLRNPFQIVGVAFPLGKDRVHVAADQYLLDISARHATENAARVMAELFTPGLSDTLVLDPDTSKPDLSDRVWAALSRFGEDHPYFEVRLTKTTNPGWAEQYMAALAAMVAQTRPQVPPDARPAARRARRSRTRKDRLHSTVTLLPRAQSGPLANPDRQRVQDLPPRFPATPPAGARSGVWPHQPPEARVRSLRRV